MVGDGLSPSGLGCQEAFQDPIQLVAQYPVIRLEVQLDPIHLLAQPGFRIPDVTLQGLETRYSNRDQCNHQCGDHGHRHRRLQPLTPPRIPCWWGLSFLRLGGWCAGGHNTRFKGSLRQEDQEIEG